jgi:ATP-binding protein involved in chromosome partitioning
MFADVSWGALDYMIVDMPPGTGDAQLSLTQLVKLAGAVVVTTPQEVALADVRKSINMLKKVNVDVLGIIENMSGLPMPDGSVMPIFGVGGGEKTAKEFGVPLLAALPIDLAIREGGDAGTPVASGDSPSAQVFMKVANDLKERLKAKSSGQGELRIVN